ncbi:hypothetical protein [Corynebacterium lactis]|uniref:hypothetical protein n=1 Tax=Corynebacterium lactis TaxID=1231000 RepID=UPI0012E18493|nr:hypothetical protein [Corynebacterium lactis]
MGQSCPILGTPPSRTWGAAAGRVPAEELTASVVDVDSLVRVVLTPLADDAPDFSGDVSPAQATLRAAVRARAPASAQLRATRGTAVVEVWVTRTVSLAFWGSGPIGSSNGGSKETTE